MSNKSFRRDKPLTIVEATKSKLVKEKSGRRFTNPVEAFHKISQERASVATDARAIREMLPEVKLVENLMVDSILSANDLTTIEPTWKLENSKFSNSSVVTEVIDVISDHFINTHKIKLSLKRYLKNMLFDYGSHTIIVLPENTVDHLINQDVDTQTGLESFKNDVSKTVTDMKNNIGLLGQGLDFTKTKVEQSSSNFGLENFLVSDKRNFNLTPTFNTLGYTVHDNPHILKINDLGKTLRRFTEKARLESIGLESFGIGSGYRQTLNGMYGAGSVNGEITLQDPKTRAEINALYTDKGHQYKEIVKAEPQSRLERETVGHPIQIEPTAEAVIPITVPGSPDEKLGVIVLLGEDGKPLNMDTEINRWNTVSSLSNSYTSTNGEDNDATASNAIRSAFTKIYGNSNANKTQNIAQLNELYTQLVVDDINQRFIDGVYGHTVSISAHENVIKVMLARHLSNMNTRMLYVPESMVTYMAFEYNADGTGRALTEDVKIIASYRSMVMMATVLAQVKSSLNHTKLRIKLDEDDMEPDDSVRQALEEFASFQASMPFGNTSYHQQYSYFQQAGVSVEVDGNDNYMDMKVDADISQRRYEAPDNDLNERLRKDFLSAYGVTTEHLDQILSSDTATAVKAATANFTKNTQNYRHMFNIMMTDYSRKYIANSQPLRKAIETVIIKYKDSLPPEMAVYFKDNGNNIKLAVNDLIREIIFELPDAVVNLSTAKIESFDSFSGFVDKWIDANISTDFINQMGVGEIGSETVELLRNTTKAILLRQFLQDNGFGTRFDELLYGTEEEATLDKVASNHIKSVGKLLSNFSNQIKESREAVQHSLTETAGDVEDLSVTTDTSGSSSFSSSSGSDDFGSFDDFDIDGDDFDAFSSDESEFESTSSETTEDGNVTTTTSESSSSSST